MSQHLSSIFSGTYLVFRLCFGKFVVINPMSEVMANSQRSITLPNEIWGEIDELAIMQSGELTRELIMRGLRAYKAELSAEMAYENKQLVNQKLKQRQGSMSQALEILKNKITDFDLETAAAISAIEKGLTD